MSNNSSNQANLPRFNPANNQPATLAQVQALISDAIASLPPSSGSQTPWMSAINAAGFGLSNLATLNGNPASTNFYSLTGTLSLVPAQMTAGKYTIMSVTGRDSVFGHLHIRMTDIATGNNLCDVDIAVDASPTVEGSVPAICQFQGVIPGGTPLIIGCSIDNAGAFEFHIIPDGAISATSNIYIEKFGSGLPPLTLSANVGPYTNECEFVPVDKQIAANALLAKTYVIFDDNGVKRTVLDSGGSLVDNDLLLSVDRIGRGVNEEALRIRTSNVEVKVDFLLATKTPAHPSSTGTTGTIAWDDSYIYICYATDSWKRAAITNAAWV